MFLRVIGDVHGKLEAYQDGVVYGSDYSVQIGDMSYDYSGLTLDPTKHKFFGGNHDDYPNYFKHPSALGNYGLREVGGVVFYFVRGAFSIDKHYRVKAWQDGHPQTWFPNEELDLIGLQCCVDAYERAKPSIVLSHDAPIVASRYITSPQVLRNFGWNPDTFKTTTQQALGTMFSLHKPKLWIFGHYHKKLDVTLDGTRFICLPELGFVDIDAEGNVYE